jgi:hypothetical protein
MLIIQHNLLSALPLLCPKKKRINTNPFTSDRSNPSIHTKNTPYSLCVDAFLQWRYICWPNPLPPSRYHADIGVTIDGLERSTPAFASPTDTVKVKNIQRTGRASLTVIKFDTRRYVTIEGPASFEPWQDTPAHIKRLKDLYVASARTPKGTDEEFAQQMRKEKRGLVLITPEHLYGSLRLVNTPS